MSLHVGLNEVDRDHYAGWDGALNACEYDANDLKAIAEIQGFEPRILLTAEATADAIIEAIEVATGRLKAGDHFFFSYSGHGGQIPDRYDDEERVDETWLAYDRQIVDDELYALWAKFQPGVRILVLWDGSRSAMVTKAIHDDAVPDPVMTGEKAAAQHPRYRAMPRDVMIATYRAHAPFYDSIQTAVPSSHKTELVASVLLISACQDDQLARDGFRNGLFTENLLAVWDGGAWKRGHAAFHGAIRSRMPDTQQPNYTRVGAANSDFERQVPFTVG